MFRRLALLSTALVARAAYPAHAQTAGLDRLPSHFAQYQGARIHYKSTGAGSSAVVFIHGWAGALEVWNVQLPVVDGKRHALFIDLPGFGIRYEVIPGSGHFVMVEHASEFNALLADFLKVL